MWKRLKKTVMLAVNFLSFKGREIGIPMRGLTV